jgi:hypothetical protein
LYKKYLDISKANKKNPTLFIVDITPPFNDSNRYEPNAELLEFFQNFESSTENPSGWILIYDGRLVSSSTVSHLRSLSPQAEWLLNELRVKKK